MEFRQLLQLAGENSNFAQKKLERLKAKHSGDDSLNVSSNAVTKHLAKQKKLKEQQKAEEDEARRKRIKARLEASTEKKQTSKIQPDKKVTNVKTEQPHNAKFKIDDKFKAKNKESKSDKLVKVKNDLTRNEERKKNNSKSETRENRENSHKVDHRKEKDRPSSSKSRFKNSSSKPTLNFSELMKIAQNNAQNPGANKRENLKRPLESESIYDPDRHLLKNKIKRKNSETVHSEKRYVAEKGPSGSEKFAAQKSNSNSNHVKQQIDKKRLKQEAIMKKSGKHQSESSNVQVKRSLIIETIPNTKTVLPVQKISSSFKQVKPGGIAAQNGVRNKMTTQGRSNIKKRAQDLEDEFAREERALERKRRLFEMRRATGNKELKEEDLFDDDYDLDEEDEYDDEFIDDSGTSANVSGYIRSIFGYDRRRFDDSDDDDLRNMESNYSQIEKEEARSARVARIEDAYEKMKEEEAEDRRTKQTKKKK